jgi:hypothetical protein
MTFSEDAADIQREAGANDERWGSSGWYEIARSRLDPFMHARIPAPRCVVSADSDELFRRMLGAEMRVDLLVEQHRSDTALGVLGRYYDYGHGPAFLRLDLWC